MGQTCGKAEDQVVEVASPAEEDEPNTFEEVTVAEVEREEEEHSLLQMLMKVEGDRGKQDELFSKLKSEGAIMICTLHPVRVEAPGTIQAAQRPAPRKSGGCGCMPSKQKAAEAPAEAPKEVEETKEQQLVHIALISHLRGLVASRAWSESVQLIKADEEKFFVFSASVPDMVKVAAIIVKLANEFPAWLPSVSPNLGSDWRVEVKIGMEAGDVLLLQGERDCYGDPVNVASKLGEDTAKAGELFLGPAAYKLAAQDDTVGAWLKSMSMKEGSIEISGTTLEYHCTEVAALGECMKEAISLPQEAEMKDCVHVADLQPETRVVFTSDMSGFTKLTKKHGILHYLRLMLNVREMFVPLIREAGGRVVKYDGDNVIAIYQDCNQALLCVDKAWQQIAEYNRSRKDEDFHIKMACGMCYGDLFIHNKDIHGRAFRNSFRLAEDIAAKFEVLVTDEWTAATRWQELPEHLRSCVLKQSSDSEVGQISHLKVGGGAAGQ